MTPPPVSSRQKQKEEARAARLAAEQRQRAADQRRQRLSMLLGAVLLAVIAVVVAIVVSQSGSKSNASPTPAKTADLFQGIPQHGNVLGYPQAKVVLEEFGDLQCPVCQEFALQSLPTIVTKYVATGKVRMTFNNLLIIGPQSLPAGEWAVAAGRQNRLWQFIDRFYAEQQEENSGYVTNDFLHRIASSVPGLNVQQVAKDAGSKPVAAVVQAQQRRAAHFGFSSTPSFLLYRAGKPPVPYQQNFDPQTLGAAIDGLLAQR